MSAVDILRLDKAIRKVARLIRLSGVDYWPILDRLESERDAILSRTRRLALYADQPRSTNYSTADAIQPGDQRRGA